MQTTCIMNGVLYVAEQPRCCDLLRFSPLFVRFVSYVLSVHMTHHLNFFNFFNSIFFIEERQTRVGCI